MEQQVNQQTNKQSAKEFKEIIIRVIVIIILVLPLCILGVYQYRSDLTEAKMVCQDHNTSYGIYDGYKVCYGVMNNITYMAKIIRLENGYNFIYPDFNYSG